MHQPPAMDVIGFDINLNVSESKFATQCHPIKVWKLAHNGQNLRCPPFHKKERTAVCFEARPNMQIVQSRVESVWRTSNFQIAATPVDVCEALTSRSIVCYSSTGPVRYPSASEYHGRPKASERVSPDGWPTLY